MLSKLCVTSKAAAQCCHIVALTAAWFSWSKERGLASNLRLGHAAVLTLASVVGFLVLLVIAYLSLFVIPYFLDFIWRPKVLTRRHLGTFGNQWPTLLKGDQCGKNTPYLAAMKRAGHTHSHTHTHIYIYMYTYIYTYKYQEIHIHTYIHTHI